MNPRNRLSAIVFAVYVFLAFYVFGASVTNALVACRTWRAVGLRSSRPFIKSIAPLLFYLITLLSTILIQIPIQVELDKRFSLALIYRLISTDLLYRRIPMAFLAGINFAMLYKVIRQSGIWLSSSQSLNPEQQ